MIDLVAPCAAIRAFGHQPPPQPLALGLQARRDVVLWRSSGCSASGGLAFSASGGLAFNRMIRALEEEAGCTSHPTRSAAPGGRLGGASGSGSGPIPGSSSPAGGLAAASSAAAAAPTRYCTAAAAGCRFLLAPPPIGAAATASAAFTIILFFKKMI